MESLISNVTMGRWLHVSEIEKLLQNDGLLPISTTAPSSPPPSGTLLLYDRSVTRNYKGDGHNWIKKRNSHKVREDHVKLKVGGKFRVSGCYVHSSSTLTFHRRAYHLLNPDTGTALYPVGNTPGSNGGSGSGAVSSTGRGQKSAKSKHPSLVLVHYLDTKTAIEFSNNFVKKGVDISKKIFATCESSSASESVIGAKGSKGVGQRVANLESDGSSCTMPSLLHQQQQTRQQQQQLHQVPLPLPIVSQAPQHQHQNQYHEQRYDTVTMPTQLTNSSTPSNQHGNNYNNNSNLAKQDQYSQEHQLRHQLSMNLQHGQGSVDPQYGMGVPTQPHAHIRPQKHHSLQSFSSSFSSGNAGQYQQETYYDEDFTQAFEESSSSLDNKTLDFLWDVVMEEGQGQDMSNMNIANLSELLTPNMFEKILERQPIGGADASAAAARSNHNHNQLATSDQYSSNHGLLSPDTRAAQPLVNHTQQQHQQQRQQFQAQACVEQQTSRNENHSNTDSFSSSANDPTDHLSHNQPVPYATLSEAINVVQHPPQSIEKSYAPFPDLVDITPDSFDLNSKVKLVVSLAAPVSIQSTSSLKGNRKYLVAFVRAVTTGDFIKTKVHRVSWAKMLNPFCFQCRIAPNIFMPGSYRPLVVEIISDEDETHIQNKAMMALNKLLSLAFYQNAGDLRFPAKCESLVKTVIEKEDFELRILSQISSENVHCVGEYSQDRQHDSSLESMSNSSNALKEHPLTDLPAPPPAMALVATVMCDFPSPPPEAVLPSEASVSEEIIMRDSSGQQVLVDMENGEVITDTSSTENGASRHEQSRKRSSSYIESSRTTSDMNDDAANISVAHNWAMAASSDPISDTKAEAVDRHCKIRFVEKLSTVITETVGEGALEETLPDRIIVNNNENDGATVVDSTEIKGMDDEQLDTILDSLLVKIVETLVEVSASECNIQDELTAPDKSGFTLLHYAALYNLQALIPVLLSRGANPDIQSSRGQVTPLHLACGAGNEAIVELLLRHGCAMNVPDSFGSYPIDHAVRNGFDSLATMLQEKIRAEHGLKTSDVTTNEFATEKSQQAESKSRKQALKVFERQRLQAAFENLSLKDKMILRMILKQRGSKKSNHSKKVVEAIAEGDECCDSKSDVELSLNEHAVSKSDIQRSTQAYESIGGKSDNKKLLTSSNIKQMESSQRNEHESDDEDGMSDMMSDTDRQSLDIAMRLMNDEELEELQNKSADIHQDLKKWMLERNYESLKEASEHLHKTLEEYKKEKEKEATRGGSLGANSLLNSPQDLQSTKDSFNQKAKIRSLKNIQSQALAALVLRKNILKLRDNDQKKDNASS